MAKTIRRKNFNEKRLFKWFENEQEFLEAKKNGYHEANAYRDYEHFLKKNKALSYSDNIHRCDGDNANVPKDYRKTIEVSWRRKQKEKLKKVVKTGLEDEYSQDKHYTCAGYTYW